MPIVRLALAFASVLALAACNRATEIDLGEDDDSVWDSGPDADGDGDGDGDGDSDADYPLEDWVGQPCDPPGEDQADPCWAISGSEDAFCFAWTDAPGGFCTRKCVPAHYPDNQIDGCGMLQHDVVCMDITDHTPSPVDDELGYAICVETCIATPTGGESPGGGGEACSADYIRCDPETWSWEIQFATCLLPKCQSDADCVTASGPTCASDDQCLASEGEWCSGDGYCVFEATCNLPSGRCSWDGPSSAEIGDPCDSLWDCPDNGICLLPDEDDYGKPIREHGYCAKEGCKAANSAAENGSGSADPDIGAEFGCGMLGSCNSGFPRGGLCLRRCAPDNSTDAFKCRQAVWDAAVEDPNGAYECIDTTGYGYWIPVSGETMMYVVMPYPSCIWVGADVGLKCDETATTTCEAFYASSSDWELNMSCRDPETGEPDTEGYCLDETTSGPTEAW